MKRQFEFIKRLTLAVMIASLVFTGCGMLDEDDDEKKKVTPTPAPTTATITGTAAAGLPIVGVVNVKGVNGNTATADIDSDGNYELEVTDLTAPYLLWAKGTVGGESVELYSTGVAAGAINITPITNYITSKVIPNLDTVIDNWATESTSVNTTALQAAEEAVQEQLAPILEAYGITEEIDLMSVEFDTDHSGLDAVLDIVEIEIDDSNNVTITNTATGNSVTGEEAFSDEEASALVEVISDTAGMNIVWTAVVTAYATEAPTASYIMTNIAPLIADQYLSNGKDRDEMLDQWIAGDGPSVGIQLSSSVARPMTESELGTYDKGYWVNLYYEFQGESGMDPYPVGMVYNGTNWLLYGNQQWVEVWSRYSATKRILTDGSINYSSDLLFDIEDEGSYAYDAGIRYALVRGPGLPIDGGDGYRYLSLENQYPDEKYSPDTIAYADDTLAATVPANAEYLVMLFETDDYTGTSPLKTSTRITPGKPYLPSEVVDSLFPTFTQPSSDDISALGIGGDVTFTWTNHAECKVKNVWLAWCSDAAWWMGMSGGTCLEMDKDVTPGVETVTFDTSFNTISSIDYARAELSCRDLHSRNRWVDWFMESSP